MRIEAEWRLVCEGCGARFPYFSDAEVVIPPHSVNNVVTWWVDDEAHCIKLHQGFTRKGMQHV